MLGLSRHGCPGPTSLVPGFLWGNSPLTLRLPPCPRLTLWHGQYLTHAPSHITREVAILIDPQSPLFLGQIKPSGSGNEKGKWRPWRESCFALIATHQHGPLNTALILQGSEGYVILMSLNEMRKSCPWLPLFS